MDWSRIFSDLASEYGFDKFDVWKLTLPQMERYMIHRNTYAKFEFEARAHSIGYAASMMFGEKKPEAVDDSEYSEMTEEDFSLLSNFLSGGA